MNRPLNFYTRLGGAFSGKGSTESGLERIVIGETIRWLREKQGLTGAELCRRSGGLDPRTLTAIEKGRIRNPSLDKLQKIARGLGCLVKDLFGLMEMRVERNYRRGTQKGAFQMEVPELGMRVISATPPIGDFFCGKLTLSPQRKIDGKLLIRHAPVFLEVVLGRLEIQIEAELVNLKEGENLFFNGGFRHSIRNPLNRESTAWLVMAPSLFRP